MKNLLIYTGPNKKFSKEDSTLAKIQIDNSLSLGWRRDDILLVTDFPYEYNGVKSVVIPDGIYYDFDKNANKIPVVLYLIKHKVLDPKKLYWCHDFDAYELNKIEESELELENFDLGLTHYFYKPQWQCSSIFLKTSAKDIFELLDYTSRAKPHQSRTNEKTLTKLINDNAIDPKRYKKLNVTYNITKRYLTTVYKEATKPLKVLHFRPSDYDKLMPDTALNMFMYGKNSIKMPLMTERLIKIFKYHRIRDDVIKYKEKDVAILIPTYKRAHKILSIYKNAKESSPLITGIYFIVEKDDQGSIDVLESHRIPYFINERSRRPAGALNTAYSKTKEKYLYTGSDDFDYKPGWLEKCLEKMVDPIKVVGTNDLHNRNVLRGLYATGFLIDRDYIRERSGTFDAEGLILSESYEHNFPDREFVEIAKLRGVYAHCLEAVVEHLHWSFGLSPKDETYSKHDGSRNRDHRLYNSRKPVWIQKIQDEQKMMT